MRKILCAFTVSVCISFHAFATNHEVVDVGFTFSPDTLYITVGDTVTWNLDPMHNVLRVTPASYAANDTIDYVGPGAFQLPFGGGFQVFNTVDTIYYVCKPHAIGAMKGVIFVHPAGFGVDEIDAIFTKIYPNPTADKVLVEGFMESANEVTYRIFDLTGKQVGQGYTMAGNGHFNFWIDLSGLPAGIFQLELNATNRKAVRKISLN